MNIFSNFGSQLFRGSVSTNSASYINKQNVNVSLDPSGTDYIDYSNNNSYFNDAHGINLNNENTTSLLLNNSQTLSPFSLSSLDEFTIYMKYKVHDVSNLPILGQIYTNPNYEISFSNISPSIGDTFTVSVLNGSNTNVTYTISGDITSADLSYADMSGVLTDIENNLTYTLNSGLGKFIFTIDNTDISASFNVLKTYFVVVQNNVLGEPVFSFSETGEVGSYYNQPDLSFGAGSKFLFDVSDPTMADISFVFGTAVDNSSTIIDSFVTYQDGVVILDICSGYVGESLKYFEDTSVGMGYYVLESIISGVDTSTDINVSFNTANASASSTGHSSYSAGKAFNSDLSQNDSWLSSWESPNKYDVNDNYSGPNNTNVDNVTISGEWLQMDFGSEKYIGKFTLSTQYNWDGVDEYDNGFMTEFVIAGSSDGSNFSEIGTYNQSNIQKSSIDYTSSEIISTNIIASRYIRLIGVKVTNNMAIREWQMKEHPLNEVISFAVEISGNKYWIKTPDYSDLVEIPQITFTSGTTYVFDISHNSNTGNTFVLGTIPDSSTSLIDYQTIVGTPGQPGAYTSFTASGETVFYYSFETPDMGYEPPTYTVKTEINVLGDTVFSIKKPGDSVYYTQPDLSFGAGFVAFFDVADIDESYNLVFGTEVDVSSTIQTQYFSQTGGTIILSIPSAYSGDSLKYFEDTNTGMGYVGYNLTKDIATSNLIDLEAEVTDDGYIMEDKTDVTGVTKNSFHISDETVVPGPNSTTELILNGANGNGYMIYMFWAYVYNDVQASSHETVNSTSITENHLGFSNMALCFYNGDINDFPNYKADTTIAEETWTHCAIVLEFLTGTFKAYYNGVEQPVTKNQHNNNKNDFTVTLSTYGSDYNANIPVYINDLFISNDALSFVDAESVINAHYFNQSSSIGWNRLGSEISLDVTSPTYSSMSNTGIVAVNSYVYEKSGNSWVQKGSDFGGKKFTSLSNDGLTIAVFQSDYSANVFDWSNGYWVQRGSDIVNLNPHTDPWSPTDYFFKISGNGNVLAIGDWRTIIDEEDYFYSTIFVYEWNGSSWVSVHPFPWTDYRTGGSNHLGQEIDLSEDGNTIIASGLHIGPKIWKRVGNSYQEDFSGIPLSGGAGIHNLVCGSISQDGLCVALVNGPYSTVSPSPSTENNFVQVFSYDVASSIWSQKGPNISLIYIRGYEEHAYHTNTFLDTNGNTITIIERGVPITNPGRLRTFQYDGSNWNLLNIKSFSSNNTVAAHYVSSDGLSLMTTDISYSYVYELLIPHITYNVTVSGDPAVFYIDGSANPQLTFTSGTTYVFDLSHNSNAGNTLVLGTVPDSSTNLIDYQTVVGTPGQPGAYTSFTASGETVFYYSFETPDMGYEPPTYIVKTEINVLGYEVFSIQKPNENVFYTQPDLSFGAGFTAFFDVADIDGSYNLVFGTEVDVSSTIQTQYYSQTGGTIILSIPSDYSGNSLKYFENTNVGMGYEQLTNNVLASDFTNTSVLDKWFTTASDADSIFTLSGETTYSFANGDYSLYASAVHSSILPHYVLDPSSVDNPTGSGTSDYDWHMYASSYSETGETIDSIALNKAPNNLSNGVTTASDGNIYSGYYLELTMPYYLFIKKIQIIGRVISAMPQNTPRKVYLCGSNDNGTTYHFITEVNFAKQTELQTISVSDVTTAYKNVRFIVNEIEGHINLEYWALIGDVLKTETYVSLVKYIVTVSNNVFYIDGSANPNLTFTSDTTYVFDLSHNSNAGNTFVLGTLPDSSTNLIDYQTIVGTPGQPGAYTSFTASGETVYYYSFETPEMGYTPTPQPQLLVVAGGGAGGNGYGGGGGAGGMIVTETTIELNQSYNIVVGEGGEGVESNVGKNGTNSQFNSFIAIAGGGGGKNTSTSLEENGQDGGSGGGGGGHGSVNLELPGAGTSGQGYSGGKGAVGVSKDDYRSAGGGGGAGGPGEDGNTNGYGGNGGPAAQWIVDQQWYAAGGGGGTRKENNPTDEKGGDGGYGGGVMLGGSGGPTPGVWDGTSAVQNTGSGGGAGYPTTNIQSGANGIVKIWLPFSYTYNSNHFSSTSGTITGSSESYTYNATSGTMVTFINPGSGTWTPV